MPVVATDTVIALTESHSTLSYFPCVTHGARIAVSHYVYVYELARRAVLFRQCMQRQDLHGLFVRFKETISHSQIYHSNHLIHFSNLNYHRVTLRDLFSQK